MRGEGKIPRGGKEGGVLRATGRAQPRNLGRLSGSVPPVRVGEANGTVELECGASPGQPLSWKAGKPWVRMEPRGSWKERVRLARLDVSFSGNYSCWAGPSLLDSVFLAVRDPALPVFGREGEASLWDRLRGSRPVLWPHSGAALPTPPPTVEKGGSRRLCPTGLWSTSHATLAGLVTHPFPQSDRRRRR